MIKIIRDRVGKWLVLPFLLAFSMSGSAGVDLAKLAKDDWHEFKTRNFHVISDAPIKVGETFIQDIENFRFFIAYILKLNVLEGVPPVKILAVERPSNYSGLGLPENLAGVFLQNLNGSYAIASIHDYQTHSRRNSWGKGILLHEYVHYVMANTFERMYYPAWYSEGIAEYLSTFQYDDEKITVGALGVIGDRFAWLSRGGRYMAIDLEDLFKTKSLNLEPEDNSGRRELAKFYARATAAVHYFKSTADTRRGMGRYIQLVNDGYEIDNAFEEAFGKSFEEVDEDIKHYLNKSAYGLVYRAGEGGLKFPSADIAVNRLDGKTLYYHMADFLTHFSFLPDKERRLILEKSIKANPDNPDLQARLADHFLNSKPEKAESILKAVLARHPKHSRARTVYGDLLLNRVLLMRKAGLEGWDALLDEARGEYRVSANNDPFYARAYRGLGQVYTFKTEDDLLKEGAVSLDSARFFANQQELPYLYSLEANLRIRMRDYKNAISAFRGYINLSDEEFGSAAGFGRYVYEALAYRELSDVEHRREGGRYVYVDGSVYTGGWRSGMPNGEGQLVRPSGATFKGTWTDGLLVGKGEFISSNGFHYAGDFSNGEITGQGVLVYPDDNEIKESRGEFFNAIAHGEQEFVYRSGDVRTGRYWMGFAHGLEQHRKADGSISVYDRVFGNYRMDFGGVVFSGARNEDGKAHGKGACYRKKDKQLFWCEYENGVEVKNDGAKG